MDELLRDSWYVRRAVTDLWNSAETAGFVLTPGIIADAKKDIFALKAMIDCAEKFHKKEAA